MGVSSSSGLLLFILSYYCPLQGIPDLKILRRLLPAFWLLHLASHMCQLAILQKRSGGKATKHTVKSVFCLVRGGTREGFGPMARRNLAFPQGAWLRDEPAEESLRDLTLSEGRSR